MNPLPVLYSLGLALALVVSAPWWLFRMASTEKYREGLEERLGRVPSRFKGSAEPTVWVHAVSVGEVMAAARLIEELRPHLSGWRIVLSTTTRTGQQIGRQRFGAGNVFYFPFDFACAVRPWLRALRPRLVVLLETEFWPRLLIECRRSGIPVAVVNARISDRSWPRYRALGFLWRPLLSRLAAATAQTRMDVERLLALGVPNVQYGGNIKYDLHVARPAPITGQIHEHLPPGAPVLVAGSTLEGEEALLLAAVPRDTVLILAPRHPERFDAVAQLIQKSGRLLLRRSTWVNNPGALWPGCVFLLDSIGELASVYSLGNVAFVGGSLVNAGGHNPLEPAQFGVPALMGPHFQNFRGIVERLQQAGAIRIVPASQLAAALHTLLHDAVTAEALGNRARLVFLSEAGASARAAAALLPLLDVPSAAPKPQQVQQP